MNHRYLLTLLAAAAIAPLSAQINSPSPDGYIARGTEMYDDHNYQGCLDQLTHIDRSSLTANERERIDWLVAQSQFAIHGKGARPHFVAFLSMYPYSLHR